MVKHTFFQNYLTKNLMLSSGVEHLGTLSAILAVSGINLDNQGLRNVVLSFEPSKDLKGGITKI